MENTQIPKPRSIFPVALFSLAAGLIIGVVGVTIMFNYRPDFVCFYLRCQATITSDRTFFADELIVYGNDPDDSPLLVRLDLNRKKVDNAFSHYYFGDVAYKDLNRQFYTAFNSPESRVQSRDFLSEFRNTPASDLSARETFAFSVKGKEVTISVITDQFNGDFLVKNTPEYTKFVNEGFADVTVDGKSFRAHVATMRIYSSDYNKYVFFDGYNTLNSVSQLFTVWDQSGNFYLLDTSDVKNDIENYKSHTWVLYRDAVSKGALKAFYARVTPTFSKDGAVTNWSIEIPDIANARMDLSVVVGLTPKHNLGTVTGTVFREDGSQPVSGFFSYNKYE